MACVADGAKNATTKAVKALVIVNPISGNRRSRRGRPERVAAFLRRARMDCPMEVTERPGHATELARKALESGAERVICVGGDGTLNEVAKVLVGAESALALVPMGSGNGLARHLGIPLDLEGALRVAMGGVVDVVDTAEANGTRFFNVMGLGLDAEIGRRFNAMKARGLLTYFYEGLKSFVLYRPGVYEIESGGEALRRRACIVAIANSAQYGGNAYIAPQASIKDGKLNLVVVEPPGPIGALAIAYRLFARSIDRSSKISALCAESFVLSLPQPGFFHADGEIFECGRELAVRALPASLRVVLPRGRGK